METLTKVCNHNTPISGRPLSKFWQTSKKNDFWSKIENLVFEQIFLLPKIGEI